MTPSGNGDEPLKSMAVSLGEDFKWKVREELLDVWGG
jgi:hypothetical protein